MTPFRRILYALIISFEIHVLVLISAAGQWGSREGPRSMSGFELIEVVRLGSRGVEARVTEEKTNFDKATPELAPVAEPSPPPAMKKKESESKRPARDRQCREDKSRQSSDKRRLKPAEPEGPEAAVPEVSPDEEPPDRNDSQGEGADTEENQEPELVPPRCAACPAPEFPELAQRRGLEGEVVLRFQVLPDGSVGDIFMEKSSGYAVLDEAAMAGVKNWTFYPATRNDKPVPLTIKRSVVFRMEPR
ncbi:MAG: energy transducer TonB [bacterium]